MRYWRKYKYENLHNRSKKCLKKNQAGKKIKITTEFPYIGRGNVLRDRLISHDKIDQEIDKILG